MKRSIQVLSGVTTILLGIASGQAESTALTQPIQDEERAALFPSMHMIEMGRDVAQTECAYCHGMDGLRTGLSQPHLAGQRAIYLYRVLQAYRNGGRENESMQHVSKFLTDEALLSVSAYYASLIPSRKPDTREAINESEVFEDDPFTGIRQTIKKCTNCHGETGNSKASGMPNLTAQDPEYFAISMQAYVDGLRSHKLMKKLAAALGESTIGELSVFYAVQEPSGTETQGEGDAEKGRRLAEECGTCHGSDGNTSNKNTPTLAGQDARYFIKAVKAYKEGGKRQHKSMLEAIKGLNENDFKDLATFYAVQEPVRRDVRMPLKTTQWIARCERCHGIGGNSTDPRFPMLAGQDEGYLRAAIQAYSAETQSGSIMHGMSDPLSGTDIERIVSYYASEEPRPVVYIQLPCPKSIDE